MAKTDKIVSLFWLLLSCGICILSMRIPIGTWDDPGPGLLPLASGITLGLLSVLAYALPGNSKSGRHQEVIHLTQWKKLFFVIGCLLFYSFFLEVLGFLLTTFLFLLAVSRIVETRPWITCILGSAFISFCCYVLFDVWLKTQLPLGILGF
jgi:putative tricarboxylic transport membrane protein